MTGLISVQHDFELDKLVRFCEMDGNLSKASDLANSFVNKQVAYDKALESLQEVAP